MARGDRAAAAGGLRTPEDAGARRHFGVLRGTSRSAKCLKIVLRGAYNLRVSLYW